MAKSRAPAALPLVLVALAGSIWPAIASAQQLTISGLELFQQTRLNRFEYQYEYYADVTNTGDIAIGVSATLLGGPEGVTVVENALTFGDVGDGATVQSIDTFTVVHDRRFPFAEQDLQWEVTASATLVANFRVEPATGDAPLTVTFFPEPITDTAVQRYEWDRDGNGSFEISDVIGRTQSFTYTAPGTYEPALRITDTNGAVDTQTRTVLVGNTPPSVSADAQPSNGPIPLPVSFTVTATDNEGIATYEWDFEGDGSFDFSSPSSGDTSFTYETVGTFVPVVRVTDTQGAVTELSVPTTIITAAPEGTPSVTLSADRTAGPAPLAVTLTANASDPDGLAIVEYAWDLDGDGTFDETTTNSTFSTTYTLAGSQFPRVRVRAADDETAEDVIQITVSPQFDLDLDTDTIDTALFETITVETDLGADSRVSLVIETRDGAVVRTLVDFTERAAGTYQDLWDGTDDGGQIVPQGAYYAILLYEIDGVVNRFDLTNSTGGQEYNPPRSSIPRSFAPFGFLPLEIDFTLSTASEVTAFMGRFNVNTRLVTFLQREPLGRGTHTITWNGEDGDGILIHPPDRDSFLFGIFGYRFPDNGIFVRSGAHISSFIAEPPIVGTTLAIPEGEELGSRLSFTLSKQADITLEVNDARTGLRMVRRTYPDVPAGTNTLLWDLKNEEGLVLGPGRYRLGLFATDDTGSQSLKLYAIQRIYH